MQKKKSFLSNLFRFQETPVKGDGPKEVVVVQSEAKGSSGTEIFAGYLSEEYLTKLQGSDRAIQFDKMRRGDARVKMCLSAVKNPIRGASWEWRAGDEGKEFEEHRDFVEYCIFKRPKKKLRDLKTELLSVVDFGHAIFERVHENVTDDPVWGSFTGLKSLAWRSPKTIEKFNVDKDGELTSVTQLAIGDLHRSVDMDAKFLTVMSLDKEGDNYEGVSLLRPCFGAWSRKNLYLKLMAVGMEKHAVPAPYAEVPTGKENDKQRAKLEEALKRFTSHQSNYLIYPEGWKIDIKSSPFDPQKAEIAIKFENTEMTFAFLANFLELGMNSTGSYALSNDLSDFFLSGIEHIAETIEDALNEVAEELVKLNYGPQEFYPTLKIVGIKDKIGKEFAETLAQLRQHDFIVPDDDIEATLRRRLELPEMKEGDRREKTSNSSQFSPQPPPQLSEAPSEAPSEIPERILLAEKKVQGDIEKAAEAIKLAVAKHLKVSSDKLKADLIKAYKDLPEASKINALKKVSAKKTKAFKDEILKELTETAFKALDRAKGEVPKAEPKKFSERIQLREFEDLPLPIRRLLLTQAGLLVDTTINDLEKAVYFQFGDSILSTDSASQIEADIEEAAQKVIDGASVRVASNNMASRIVNEARSAFFFDEGVLSEIDSFTFSNPDPKSAICRDLNGRTFSKTDPVAQRYFPPLHHNCKSIIVPNLVGSKSNPQVSPIGLRPSKAELEKDITLKECCA